MSATIPATSAPTPTNSPTDPSNPNSSSAPTGRDATGRRFTDLNKAAPDSRAAEVAYLVIGIFLALVGLLAMIALILFSQGSGFILAGIIAPIVLNIGLPLSAVATVITTVTGFVLMTLGLTNEAPVATVVVQNPAN